MGEAEDRSRHVEDRVELLRIADSGVLDGIRCPECGGGAVSVKFTRPAEEVYRTWFVCAGCGFRMRAQNAGRPRFFGEELVDRELEEYDRGVLRKKRRSG